MKIQFSPVKKLEDATVFWYTRTPEVEMLADWRFGQELPFSDGMVQVAYIFRMFSHVEESRHDKLAKELFRIMAPNGQLYIIEDDFDYLIRSLVGGDLKIEEYNKQFINKSCLNMDLLVSHLKAAGFEEKKMAVWNEAQSFPKSHHELVLSAKK